MTIIVTIFIVSIITEHLVIQRLQLNSSAGVEILNGGCRLKQGFGKLGASANLLQHPPVENELDNFYNKLL